MKLGLTFISLKKRSKAENGSLKISQDQSKSGTLSAKKIVVAVFFNKSGFFHVVPLEKGKTINAEWYTTVCLNSVFEKYTENKPATLLRKVLFHHDNASSHTAIKTVEFLAEKKVQQLPHPPYSPDLSPADYFLFPKIKDSMRGKRYSTKEEVYDTFLDELKSLAKDDWKRCFENWFERMDKCIELDGDYFEKTIKKSTLIY